MPTPEGPPLSIRKALKDQHVFVTGATGFVVKTHKFLTTKPNYPNKCSRDDMLKWLAA
jgi:hypothetical protein